MIFYIIILPFLALSLSWYWRIYKTATWVQRNRHISQFNPKRNIFVVIPVLDETKRVEQTVGYFLRTFKHLTNMCLVLVSTKSEYAIHRRLIKNLLAKIKYASKEDIRAIIQENTMAKIPESISLKGLRQFAKEAIINKESTINLCNRLSKSKKIIHFHYPKAGGRMAHQLNYGINILMKKHKDCLFAVYNADSRPDPKTFDWILSKRNINVFQQYGNYFKNINESTNTILWSAAGWQTRWSLGFEIFHALQQFKFHAKKAIQKTLRYPMNYCVGHGLIFTPKIFKELQGFNENTHNEDAIFGLELSYLGEIIMPIPYFDMSDSPNSVHALYVQKATWFFGPLEAFSYIKEIIKKHKEVNLFSLLILSSKLFSHAVYWIAGPTMLTFSLFLAIMDFSLLKVSIWIVIYCMFLVLPNFGAWLVTNRDKNNNALVFLKMFAGSFAQYFLHGFSAYKTTIDCLIYGKNVRKQKTPN